MAAVYLAAGLIERQYHTGGLFRIDRIAHQTGLDTRDVARLRDAFLSGKPAHAALLARIRQDLNTTTKGIA
jgi:hypothetical protein